MMEFGSPIFARKDPKPASRRLIPPSPSPSSIPFSWEQQPGIPKSSPQNPITKQSDPLLPLPPPLRPAPDNSLLRTKHRPDPNKPGSDPFALALAECTKSTKHPSAAFADVAEAERRRRRRGRGFVGPTWRVGDRFGLLDVFGSCKKAACSVSESAVYVPRSGPYGLLNRRSG